MVEPAAGVQQQHAFLSMQMAEPQQRALAKLIGGLSLLGFIVGLAFVRVPLARIPAFIPAYEAALWIINALTAVLLFAQFARLRSRALLALAAGYLFDSCMIVSHGLSFPGVFSPTGLMGAGPQTTAWLYVFWHAGFPFFVLGYVWLAREPCDAPAARSGRLIGFTVAGIMLVAVALTLLATVGHDLLPVVIQNGDYSLLVTKGISPAVWALSAVALVALWRRSLPSVLELWLMVVMMAWTLDIAFSAVIGSNRYDFGFYAGRLYGLFAASFVLGTLLLEMNRLYGKVADALSLAETRNADLIRSRDEFARVQRFDAIGQLVGGVAHDFNNLLTVIIGALDLTMRHAGIPPACRCKLDMSMQAARRGAKVTGQLLTFARKQILQPEMLRPNEVIANLEALFSGATGETIEVVTEFSPVLWPVHLDRTQFETALINLILNARDALKGNGRIVVSTRNATVCAGASDDLRGGDYVIVSVTDAGSGMPPEVVARAIDPFFTTKEVGKGSGLGLSQVYGFVTAASGYVRIDSAVGRGTTVEMCLPRSKGHPAQAMSSATLPTRASTGHETILVVEDDPDVLNIAVAGLLDLGYAVKTATDAHQGLAIIREDPSIDVLFSDVVMPGGMNGAQLAVEARRVRPDLKILLTSGYTAAALTEHHGLSDREEMLRKPYRREELATKLRLVME
jgi:signal transduction histidine kinase